MLPKASTIPLALATTVLMSFALTISASAHGDAPHPTCKKGYVVTDDHKCVKAPS